MESVLKELAEILNETDKNKKIRCVVITGNEKSFSSGADMKEAPESEMPFRAEKNRKNSLIYTQIDAKELSFSLITEVLIQQYIVSV